MVQMKQELPMKPQRPNNIEPDLEIRLPISIPHALDLECSMYSLSDADAAALRVIDVLGSAVAEATGWRPPEAEDANDGQT